MLNKVINLILMEIKFDFYGIKWYYCVVARNHILHKIKEEFIEFERIVGL